MFQALYYILCKKDSEFFFFSIILLSRYYYPIFLTDGETDSMGKKESIIETIYFAEFFSNIKGNYISFHVLSPPHQKSACSLNITFHNSPAHFKFLQLIFSKPQNSLHPSTLQKL